MLGKSKGQVLRGGACLHVLFGMFFESGEGQEKIYSDNITEKAIVAAINFTELRLQQTAFMAGRGNIREDIENIRESELIIISLVELLFCDLPYCCVQVPN